MNNTTLQSVVHITQGTKLQINNLFILKTLIFIVFFNLY